MSIDVRIQTTSTSILLAIKHDDASCFPIKVARALCVGRVLMMIIYQTRKISDFLENVPVHTSLNLTNFPVSSTALQQTSQPSVLRRTRYSSSWKKCIEAMHLKDAAEWTALGSSILLRATAFVFLRWVSIFFHQRYAPAWIVRSLADDMSPRSQVMFVFYTPTISHNTELTILLISSPFRLWSTPRSQLTFRLSGTL